MGIQGLLPMLKEIATPVHIKEFKGQTLAVDAYVWLHKGAYGCAEELATGKITVKYVNYAMHRVRMLKYYGVTPLIVFDGGLLPSKMGTEDEREKRRADALAKGRALKAEGRTEEARKCWVKAIDVTPEMAFQLIKALRRDGIQYIVAPYEADPQLSYLEKHGLVDGIITEDSDLLVFGCRNVLFKLDGDGNCVQIQRKDFSKCREYNFSGWTDAEFRQMAILSGCDYIDSIKGMGLVKAYRLMKKCKTVEKAIQSVRFEGQMEIPLDYAADFQRAELTFCHQRVFDPRSKTMVHHEPLPDGLTAEDLPFVGAAMELEYVRGLANGDIDPLSKLAMIDINPDAFSPSKTYRPVPFKATSKSTSRTVVPVKGAGSLLSFFQRQPAPVASTSKINIVTPTNQPTALRKRNSSGGVIPLQKENRPVIAQSKFFGGGVVKTLSTGKGKGKGKAKEQCETIVLDDELELMEFEEVEEEEFPDDTSTVYPQDEWDQDAEDNLRALELEEMKLLPSLLPRPPTPPSRPREPSSSIGISSPVTSPVAFAKRRRLSPSLSVLTEIDSQPKRAASEDDGDVLSSPSASPTPHRVRHGSPQIKLEKVKHEQTARNEKGKLEEDVLMSSQLESDPIEIASESATVATSDDIVTPTKRNQGKSKRVPKIKQEMATVVRKSTTVKASLEIVEGDENFPPVAVVWRQKFTMTSNLATSRTPLSKCFPFSSTSAIRSLPTPASLNIAAIPATSKRRLSKTASEETPVPRTRLPPSPKTSLHRAKVIRSPAPPSPKNSSSQSEEGSQKVIVTNPILLSYRYKA